MKRLTQDVRNTAHPWENIPHKADHHRHEAYQSQEARNSSWKVQQNSCLSMITLTHTRQKALRILTSCASGWPHASLGPQTPLPAATQLRNRHGGQGTSSASPCTLQGGRLQPRCIGNGMERVKSRSQLQALHHCCHTHKISGCVRVWENVCKQVFFANNNRQNRRLEGA